MNVTLNRFMHMWSLLKNALLIILTALSCFGIFSIYQKLTQIKRVDQVTSVVLLERVERVFQLVTVEGNFSEIYNYENHIFADLWPFRKKALVQVNAKVSVGYNFESINFITDEDNKILKLDGPLDPEILSIDHDVKGYEFNNGLFNMISDDDITQMGAEAKAFIKIKAEESDLFSQSEEQKKELIDMLKWILKASDWELQLNEPNLLN